MLLGNLQFASEEQGYVLCGKMRLGEWSESEVLDAGSKGRGESKFLAWAFEELLGGGNLSSPKADGIP